MLTLPVHRGYPCTVMKAIHITALVVLAVCTLSAAGQLEIVFMPRNESGLDQSLDEFWQRLIQAVEERDAYWVISMLSPRVRNTFGDDYGVDSFHEIWQPYSEESPLWAELEAITSLGGTFFDSTLTLFMAPYVFSEWPPELDSFTYGAVIDISVPLYAEPDEGSEILKVLSYDIVRIRYNPEPPEGWRIVELLDGTPGYLLEHSVRRPTDHRIGIERFDTGWEIVFLIAGD